VTVVGLPAARRKFMRRTRMSPKALWMGRAASGWSRSPQDMRPAVMLKQHYEIFIKTEN